MTTPTISAGSRISSNAYIGRGARIFPHVEIGDKAFIDDNVTIGYPNEEEFNRFIEDLQSGRRGDLTGFVKAPTSIGNSAIIKSGTVVCSGTTVGPDLYCDHGAYIGGNNTIGKNAVIQYGAMIYDNNAIGDDVTISGFVCNGCKIGKSASMLGFLVHKYDRPVEATPEPSPVVEEGATIGMLAVVIGKVTVGRNAYVGAGAVVTRDVAPGSFVTGIPARVAGQWRKNVV